MGAVAEIALAGMSLVCWSASRPHLFIVRTTTINNSRDTFHPQSTVHATLLFDGLPFPGRHRHDCAEVTATFQRMLEQWYGTTAIRWASCVHKGPEARDAMSPLRKGAQKQIVKDCPASRVYTPRIMYDPQYIRYQSADNAACHSNPDSEAGLVC